MQDFIDVHYSFSVMGKATCTQLLSYEMSPLAESPLVTGQGILAQQVAPVILPYEGLKQATDARPVKFVQTFHSEQV